MKERFIYLFVVPLFVILGLSNINAFGSKGYYTLCIKQAMGYNSGNIPIFLQTAIVKNPVSRILISSVVLFLLAYIIMFFLYDMVLKKIPPRRLILAFSILFVTLEVLIPMGFVIVKRAYGKDKKFLSHDGGVIQTEIATSLMMKGNNPYGHDYFKTRMADSFHLEKLNKKGVRLDPDYTALYHYPYFPGSFLLSIPFKFISDKLLKFYDQRLIYLALYIIMLISLYKISLDEFKPIIPVLFGIFPIFTGFIITGRNEIFYISLMIISIYLFYRKHYKRSFFMLALSFSVKQFAILLLPFYMIFLIKKKVKFLPGLLIFIITTVIIILPFYLWNSTAFLDDTMYHSSGISKTPYPMGGTPGYGFSNYIMIFGNYKNRYGYFPFHYFSLATLLLVFLAGVFSKSYGLKELLYNFSIGFLVFSFFGRMFHDNYLITAFFLLGLSLFIKDGEEVAKR
ncbi:hypothetical protein KAJ27_24335 [bacterium]|nr:hypothetical protein [bacterium]